MMKQKVFELVGMLSLIVAINTFNACSMWLLYDIELPKKGE